ncbi:MAG TPA: 50S ribosomal protein L6 [Candidatus Vogelbacteria bacterium]|nr:50S ribosomal protein L6 [Candidatus Vogelbacteria bacterium]
MSRIGKQIITIPDKVKIDFTAGVLKVTGPLGELQKTFLPKIEIKVNEKEISLNPKENGKLAESLWGTYASHIKNMIQGVTEGFEKKLVIEGVGYKFNLVGEKIVLGIGYSHDVNVVIPPEIKCSLEKNILTVNGIDKEKVGEFTARLRQYKKTEPYKGKGIRYIDEVPRRKQGKKVVG